MPLRAVLDSAGSPRETSPAVANAMRWDWKVLLGIVIAAAAAGWLLTRSFHQPESDLGDLDTDLAELSQALRADATADVELIPRASAGIHLPNVLNYRRPSDFWRPALGGGPRRGRR
jgi:hypothetical protein